MPIERSKYDSFGDMKLTTVSVVCFLSNDNMFFYEYLSELLFCIQKIEWQLCTYISCLGHVYGPRL